MKIFSLQSKWSLVGWSLALGAILFFFSIKFSSYYTTTTEQMSQTFMRFGGFPLSVLLMTEKSCALCELSANTYAGNQYQYVGYFYGLALQPNFWLDLLFWILVVFISFSLIKFIKNKKPHAVGQIK